LYGELSAKLIRERKEKMRRKREEAEGKPAASRPASLIDAIVQGQVQPGELAGLAEAQAPAAAVESAPDAAVERPRRKRKEKAVRGPRKRRKRKYFWLVLKDVRTPGMRTKLHEGEWVEEMDAYDYAAATTPEEREVLEQDNAEFQKARPRAIAPVVCRR